MTEAGHREILDALRLDGADRFDPVRFHYMEVLCRRASTHQGSVQRILDAKLAQATATFRQRLELAQSRAINPSACPETVEPRVTLGDLVRQIALHSHQEVDATGGEYRGSRAELRSVRHFRNTWSKLSANRQVTQALDQPPKNAGPINSHRVVLRSLALMRDTSPDYLNRFMSYVDTLLCLDQQGDKGALHAKAPRQAKAAKK